MDWKAVAELLVERGAPIIVVDRALRVEMIDERLTQLLELDRGAILGAPIDDGSRIEPLRALAARARDGPVTASCTIVTSRGDRVELQVEATHAGSGRTAATMLVVVAAVVRAPPSVEPRPSAFEYEIGAALSPFGRLRRLALGHETRHYWFGDAPRCHEVLHSCPTPCADCPALRVRHPFPVTVRDRRPGRYEVLRAEGSAEGTVRVDVRLVPRDHVVTVHRARLNRAMAAARLSPYERAVLVALGESAVSIAAAHGTSPGHVRRHQVAALRRLGASGRADLLCLLL
ncbi:MAG: hypothetical protein KIS83_21465 [Rubrivivax sp.]|nr:hypothetical protein [Labilithrix sp.]MCW5613216.1 hypothetical protein [Rubrivivax sp.]MCW5833675.1 hypothetical protein [Labilithrix sp.]